MMNKTNQKININGLEINISERCNLRCKGCDHGLDTIIPRHIPRSALFRDIKKASRLFHSKTLRIIGGEPLLHPDLSQIIYNFKTVNIADSLELWTNGILLETVTKTNWELLDGIVISQYPYVHFPWDNSIIKKYANEFNIWFYIRNCCLFKWSLNPNKKNCASVAKILHNNCRECGMDHTIRNGKFYKCVQSAFAKDRLFSYGIHINDDGIDLNNSSFFFEEFENHMWSKIPLNTCYYCLGEFGAYFPHEQISLKEHNIINVDKIGFDNHFIVQS